jgi:hypothetical protein
VKSGAVVEGLDVIKDGSAGLGAGGEAMMIDQFVFEAAKERLDEGVIVAVAKFSKSIAGADRAEPFFDSFSGQPIAKLM